MKNQLDPSVILSHLKEIEYITVGLPIFKSWYWEVVGWNLFSSSMIRKNFTIERLREEIEINNLPLEIKDHREFSNAFQVYIV